MQPENTPFLNELKRKSSQGIKWQALAEVVIRVAQFGTTIILARLLLPRDFGLISVALIFTQLAYVIFDFGFSTALIQKKNIGSLHYSTTFVVYLLSAVLFAGLVFVSSDTVAVFFENAVLREMLNTMTLLFLFYAVSAIPRILLMRAMRFRRFGLLQVIAVVCYAAVTISLARAGFGVWSFVYGSLIEQGLLAVLLNIFSWWKPSLRFSMEVFREMFAFGGNVLGTRITGYINSNAPNFIIGKLLGAVTLGYYSIAYQLVEFPVQRIAKSVLKVMFPAFSQVQDDDPAFRNLYQITIYFMALITFPLFFGLAIVAPQFVPLLYGPGWEAAIRPLQILTIVGLARSFWVMTSAVFLSRGKPELEFRINLMYSLALIPVLLVSARYGINMVAVGLAAAVLVFLILAQVRAFSLIGLPYTAFLKQLRIASIGSASFIILIILVRWAGLAGQDTLIHFAVAVIISVLVYSTAVYLQDRKIVQKLMRFLRS